MTSNFDFSKPRNVQPLEAYNLAQALEEFETVLRNELQNADTYFVSGKAAYDTSLLISNAELVFSSDLATKVTAAIPDVREAGKCLAFELNTAAGFHIMRAVETVLRSYWDSVSSGAVHPRQNNLGVYLHRMEQRNFGTAKVRAALQQFKDLHRNPLIHPEVNLTKDEAISIFGIAQSVINEMLKAISAIVPVTLSAAAAAATPVTSST